MAVPLPVVSHGFLRLSRLVQTSGELDHVHEATLPVPVELHDVFVVHQVLLMLLFCKTVRVCASEGGEVR